MSEAPPNYPFRQPATAAERLAALTRTAEQRGGAKKYDTINGVLPMVADWHCESCGGSAFGALAPEKCRHCGGAAFTHPRQTPAKWRGLKYLQASMRLCIGEAQAMRRAAAESQHPENHKLAKLAQQILIAAETGLEMLGKEFSDPKGGEKRATFKELKRQLRSSLSQAQGEP